MAAGQGSDASRGAPRGISFAPPEPGSRPERRKARLARLPAPERRYGVLFMPRSSSSRLTAIAKGAGLGTPGEFLNPELMPAMVAALGSASMAEHEATLLRRFSDAGAVWGIEVTPRHVRGSYGDLAALSEAFGIDRWAWLVRRDIAAQAVSAVRMSATGLAHDDGTGAPPAPARLPYRPRAIARAVLRLLWMERMGEAMVRRLERPPLRLSYEGLTAMSEAQVAAGLADWLGLPPPSAVEGAQHRRLPPAGHAERFCASNRLFMRAVDAARARTLRALPDAPFGS